MAKMLVGQYEWLEESGYVCYKLSLHTSMQFYNTDNTVQNYWSKSSFSSQQPKSSIVSSNLQKINGISVYYHITFNIVQLFALKIWCNYGFEWLLGPCHDT